jgi:import inner membrane translocase subunit TIM44
MTGLRHLVRVCRARHHAVATRGFAKRAKKNAPPAAAATGSGPTPSSAGSSEDAADVPTAGSRSASEAEPGTAGAAAEEAARAARAAASGFGSWAKAAGAKAAEASKRGYSDAQSKVPPSASGLFGKVVDAFKEEYRLAMMDPGDAAAERRKQRPGYVAPGPVEEYTGTTAVAAVEKKKTAFQRAWERIAEKTGVTSVFSKLEALTRSSGVYKKGTDALEDIREKWETSESPLVHRIQDMQDGLFTETEQAEAYRVIRQRQPDFNINGFLAEVRRDVPKVLGAYLKGDLAALEHTNIAKEMLERMGGQMKLWRSEQQFVDPRILHLSELELVEVRLMDGEPLVVLQFSCQQINCVRNNDGEIVDGAEDDIQAVHYLWAMQLSPKQFVSADGREYSAQTWQLREMVLRGMMAVAA